jgi:hypothetical protein
VNRRALVVTFVLREPVHHQDRFAVAFDLLVEQVDAIHMRVHRRRSYSM